MRISARIAIGVLGASVLLGGIGVVALRKSDPAGPAASATDVAHPAWPMRERRNYKVRLKSRVTLGEEDLLRIEIEGELVATRINASKLELSMRMDAQSVGLSTSPEEQAGLQAALREPFAATFGAGGLVETIAFAEAPKPEPSLAVARGLVRTTVSALQVAAPPDAAATEWSGEERDSIGSVSTRYQRRSSDVLKTKTAYLRVSSRDPLIDARTDLVSSVAELEFRGATPGLALLTKVGLREATRVEADGPVPKLSSDLEVDIELVDSALEDEATVAALARAVSKHQRTALDDRSVENRMTLDHAKLKGPSFAELLVSLAELGRGDARQRARVFALLEARLRFDDGNVQEA
jgi:hypothetical protein